MNCPVSLNLIRPAGLEWICKVKIKKSGSLLVDDHAVVRAGYQLLLKQSDKIEIVAEASSGEQASKLFTDLSPDVVVMDLSLPGISGLEAIRRIIRKDANAKILVFSMHEDTVFVDQALRAGARGYLTKSSAPKTLIKAIEEIAKGVGYISMTGWCNTWRSRRRVVKSDRFPACPPGNLKYSACSRRV